MVLANTTSSCNGSRSIASIIAGGHNAGSCKRIIGYHLNKGNSIEQSYFHTFGIKRGFFGDSMTPYSHRHPYMPRKAYR